MSKPIFEDLFKFSGRRNRKSYNLLVLVELLAIAILFAMVVAIFMLMESSSPLIGYLLIPIAFVLFFGIAVSSWAAGSQRIRDFGQSGVWILLTLAPYIGWVVSIAIMFVPSEKGENKYGPSCI